MKFSWDSGKNEQNIKKHGISFEKATALWEDIYLEVEDLAYSQEGETRSATLGRINNKVYLAIWCRRKELIRLISVRRARKNEEKIFLEKIR